MLHAWLTNPWVIGIGPTLVATMLGTFFTRWLRQRDRTQRAFRTEVRAIGKLLERHILEDDRRQTWLINGVRATASHQGVELPELPALPAELEVTGGHARVSNDDDDDEDEAA